MDLTFQGDVDIVKIESIPKSATPLDTKTVMYGEKTGHHHTFAGGQVLVYEPTQNDTTKVRNGETVQIQKYVNVIQDTQITHQEHATQVIPKGMYAILQEREWDVMDKQLRRVID